MDRGSKPPPSHPSVTWACDREVHTTGCVLKGSRVVGTWETGPILGVPCCVEMRTLLQCVCPRHGGDSASVGSLCPVIFPYCCSHKVVTISLCPFLTASFSSLLFSLSPSPSLPSSWLPFFSYPCPCLQHALPSVHDRAELSAPYGSTACKSMHFSFFQFTYQNDPPMGSF